MVGDYYEQEGQLGKAIKYFDSNNEAIRQFCREGWEEKCVARNLKLAQLYKMSGRHKESLEKFRSVHKVEKKANG